MPIHTVKGRLGLQVINMAIYVRTLPCMPLCTTIFQNSTVHMHSMSVELPWAHTPCLSKARQRLLGLFTIPYFSYALHTGLHCNDLTSLPLNFTACLR